MAAPQNTPGRFTTMFCAGLEYQKQGNKKQADMHNFGIKTLPKRANGINIKAAAVPTQS
jgi:hypothetical protein